MSKLSKQKSIAATHLRAAYVAISRIPEKDASSDHGNLSSATDHIEAAVSRLGGEFYISTKGRQADEVE